MSTVLQKIRQRIYSFELLKMIHVCHGDQILYRLPSIERIPYKVEMPHRKRAGFPTMPQPHYGSSLETCRVSILTDKDINTCHRIQEFIPFIAWYRP
jgi:hypothetical protein